MTERWIVSKEISGWNIRHTGPSQCRFQPNQWGKIDSIFWTTGHEPPIPAADIRVATLGLNTIHGLGTRWGTRHSNLRKALCDRMAEALNAWEGSHD